METQTMDFQTELEEAGYDAAMEGEKAVMRR
jgi:hypothetical protein